MIKPIDSFRYIEKTMRNFIISQSELSSDKVRNANSVRGVDLEKQVASSIYSSFDLNDTLIIFEIVQRDSENNISMEEEDDSLTIYNSLSCKLIIYGNASFQLAQILKARFESDAVGYNLWTQGIFVNGVSNITSLNEFKNNTVWLRTDLEIEISCKFSISQIENIIKQENLTNINILNEEDED